MMNRRKKCSSLWRTPKNITDIKTTINDMIDVNDLKTATKRISIMSKLQQKTLRSNVGTANNKYNKSNSFLSHDTNIVESKSLKRPQTSKTPKINSMNSAQKAYIAQKKISDKLISQNYQSQSKYSRNNIKQGLLGQYSRYQEMSKEQLIQKLISLQYLANSIFKKNKFLQQKIKQVDPSIIQNN